MKKRNKPLGKLRSLVTRSMGRTLSCRKLESFLVDYLDGVLPEAQRRQFDEHLRLCSDCKHYLESYKQTIAATNATFCDDSNQGPGDMPESLVQAILAAREKDA